MRRLALGTTIEPDRHLAVTVVIAWLGRSERDSVRSKHIGRERREATSGRGR